MTNLSDLIRAHRDAMGLSLAEVVRKTPYQNLNKGIRRLEQLEHGHPPDEAEVLHWFSGALGIPVAEADAALAEDQEAEARAINDRIDNKNHLYRLIIQHHAALVARDPWLLVPFATSSRFGDRKICACIGAMALIWERAADLQPICNCGNRFHVVAWGGFLSTGSITAFCPGCAAWRDVYRGGSSQCANRLAPYLENTPYHMSGGVFPGAHRPASKDVLMALAGLGVEISGITSMEAGQTAAFFV